jgi:hypothetical protein
MRMIMHCSTPRLPHLIHRAANSIQEMDVLLPLALPSDGVASFLGTWGELKVVVGGLVGKQLKESTDAVTISLLNKKKWQTNQTAIIE